MKNKSEVFVHFCAFQRLVENKFNTKIKTFQSDGGGEFDNMAMLAHFSNSGISFHKSCPDTPQQNRVAERKHRHVIEIVRTVLAEATLPSHFWVDAAYYAVYTINRLPTPNLQGFSHLESIHNQRF